jgi:hypothetical protein
MELITSNRPTFIVVGAAKCGTTSLYHYLDKHPEVYMSPIKETNHFSSDIDPENFSSEYKLHEARKHFNLDKWLAAGMPEKRWGWYVKKRDQYWQLFGGMKNEKAAGEISNSYLFSSTAAQEIKYALPDAKIIMMLRNPIDRLYSHYLANLRDGKTLLTCFEELNYDMAKIDKGWGISHLYIELGLYYQQVKRYLDTFDKENIRIYFHDDYKKDPEGLVRDMFEFIGVDKNIVVDFNEKHNEAKVPKNKYFVHLISVLGIKKKLFRLLPQSMKKKIKSSFFKNEKVTPLTIEERNKIIKYYNSDIEKLGVLVGRDLSQWT